MIKDEYLQMTIADLLKHLEENKPQKNMVYHLEISSYGINISKGMENKDYHTKERHILARGDKAIDLLTKSKEELRESKPHQELTDIQKERKEKVLSGQKLSEAQLEMIRYWELDETNEFYLSKYSYGIYPSNWDKTEVSLVKRNIAFESKVIQFYLLKNPLAYMTDEGFNIWLEGKKDA